LGLAADWTAIFEIHVRGGRATLVTDVDVRRRAAAWQHESQLTDKPQYAMNRRDRFAGGAQQCLTAGRAPAEIQSDP
jgi:hypothetical protein